MNNSTITLIFMFFLSSFLFSQVQSNKENIRIIYNHNPFMDASTNNIDGSNKGVGLVFPRTDLTTFTFITNDLDGVSFPTAFDGMIVYNNGECSIEFYDHRMVQD